MTKVTHVLVIALLVLLLIGGGVGVKYEFFPCRAGEKEITSYTHAAAGKTFSVDTPVWTSASYKAVWCNR